MFIANNSIFKSIICNIFFSQVNSAEGVLPNDEFRSIALKECYLMMNFEKKVYFTIFKISVKMQI